MAAVGELGLVEKAKSMTDAIRSRVERAEQERKLPEETVEEFKQAGFTRALQAKRYGGLEATPEEFYQAVIELGKVCTSSSWIAGVLAVHPFQFAQLPKEAQDDLFGDDVNTIVSSSYAPTGKVERVKGGYHLSGRWSFSSGCDHATWVVLGGIVADAQGTPQQRIFLVPLPEYRIDDDWYVMGLSGTGSKSIIVEDAFVPEHRSMGWAECCNGQGPGLEVNPGPIFRLPFLSVFGACLSMPAIGAAKGAYAEFCRQAGERVRAMDRRPASEDPYLQLRVAHAAAEIDAVELQVMRDFREAMEQAEAGRKISMEDRTRYRWHQIRALDTCSRVIKSLLESGGGAVVYQRNPIQRFMRDVMAMHQHTANNVDTMAGFMARVELGLSIAEFEFRPIA
ncbi:MAG TPA: acyl-CoA dehydrogenase family protein [Dehalococcoidia bacterium]|nr:acyl-CoA dehydrogenase family protein [Dehalococcoidia bacterium]